MRIGPIALLLASTLMFPMYIRVAAAPAPTGTTVTVYLPVSAAPPLPLVVFGTQLHLTSDEITDVALPGCSTEQLSLHSAVVGVPGASIPQSTNVLVEEPEDAQPGTRVVGFESWEVCVSDGTNYVKLTGAAK